MSTKAWKPRAKFSISIAHKTPWNGQHTTVIWVIPGKLAALIRHCKNHGFVPVCAWVESKDKCCLVKMSPDCLFLCQKTQTCNLLICWTFYRIYLFTGNVFPGKTTRLIFRMEMFQKNGSENAVPLTTVIKNAAVSLGGVDRWSKTTGDLGY